MPHPIRVLHLITGLMPGGAERQLLILLRALDRERYQPEVAYLKGAPDLQADFEAAGVRVHRIAAPGPVAVFPLVRLLNRGHFRLLHTHLVQADLVGAVASAITKVALVSSRHNDDAFLRDPVIRLVYRVASSRARRVIAISESLRRFVIENRTVDDAGKVTCVRYGLDPALVEVSSDVGSHVRAELDISATTTVIGILARLVEQKGHQYLFKAMPQIVATHGDVVLLVVGAGELREDLEALADTLGIRAHVRFLGFRKDTSELMAALDIFVLPSLWEGFGLVLLEAMACRKPIVASRVSAIPEIVEDGRTGYLVEPRNHLALATALSRLIGAPGVGRELGEEGRRRLESAFSVERMVSDIQRIYDELLVAEARPALGRTSQGSG